MNCPICSAPLSKHFVAGEFSWCESCRTLLSFSSLQNGQPEAFLCLTDDSEFPKGITYSLTDDRETVSTRTFSFLGIPLVLLTLFWLFLTLISLAIHIGLGLLMAVVLLGMAAVSLTFLSCRLSLTFYPKSGLIVYAKGPFRWLSVRRKFNGQDVSDVREGELIAAEGNIPRPVVFFKNGKNLMLDFSKKESKREFLELVLFAFITRA